MLAQLINPNSWNQSDNDTDLIRYRETARASAIVKHDKYNKDYLMI